MRDRTPLKAQDWSLASAEEATAIGWTFELGPMQMLAGLSWQTPGMLSPLLYLVLLGALQELPWEKRMELTKEMRPSWTRPSRDTMSTMLYQW